MKIAIARIYHETNTFNPNLTTLEALKQYGYYEGEKMFAEEVVSAELLGAVERASKLNIKLVGLIKVGGWAGGILKQKDYEYIKNRLLKRLEESLPVDGVYLSLHGALVSEEESDVEGDILKSVRESIGAKIPIAASCDMHGNITQKMVENSDAIVGYHTCPHLDSEEIGSFSIQLLYRLIKAEVKPVMFWCKIPMITPADRHNSFNGPLKDIFDKVSEIESKPDVLSVSVFTVQPWLDVPELGWTVVVVINGEGDKGTSYCQELAKLCWDKRKEFEITKLSAKDAVNEANQVNGHPVVVSDGADATNSGSVGNSTHILYELLNQDINGKALVPLVDPAMARLAHSRGVGSIVEGEVGRFPENPFSNPIRIKGKVIDKSDGKFTISGHGGRNFQVDMGKVSALDLGNVILVVSEKAGPGHDPILFRHIGLKPEDVKIVVVKSPVGFRAAYEPFAKEIILIDTPGAASSNLKSFNFTNRPKPIYPFEDIEEPKLCGRLKKKM